MTNPAIIGLGVVGPYRHSDIQENFLQLAGRAVVDAARDAGLDRGGIDGLSINSGGDAGPDYDQLANYLGLDVRTAIQSWAHGRFTATAIYQASLLVRDGLADAVACVYARRLASDVVGGPGWKGWQEELRQGGGPHGEDPSVGLTAPLGNAAIAARLYSETYGVKLDRLHGVVNASRRNATKFPGALRSGAVSLEQYQDNPFVVEPLRRWDCTPRTEGAVCVIVGDPKAAASPQRAAKIAGFTGVPAGPDEFIWSRPGLGMNQQAALVSPEPELEIFRRAGVDREATDVFLTYDAFSPLVWFALERYGYCPPGEAADFVDAHGLTADSSFPTNTHGGSLAAGQLAGWLQIAEAIHQLRGEAGARQVPDAAVAHYGTCYGDSLVLTQ